MLNTQRSIKVQAYNDVRIFTEPSLARHVRDTALGRVAYSITNETNSSGAQRYELLATVPLNSVFVTFKAMQHSEELPEFAFAWEVIESLR